MFTEVVLKKVEAKQIKEEERIRKEKKETGKQVRVQAEEKKHREAKQNLNGTHD